MASTNKGGDALREARLARNLSQRETAILLGCNGNELSDYENGRKKPGRERAVKIEKELGVAVDVWD